MSRPPFTIVQQHGAAPLYDLTIVTVCRDVLLQLKRTTASVLEQKSLYPNVSIEHVIVDGASTDGTPEWLADQKTQGKIEAYVSEPDCGIYDAMNKGINMARGKALAFLNAGDTYTGEDLGRCIHPIIEGESPYTAAYSHVTGHPTWESYIPTFQQMYLYSPCSHQAFFAATSLYRSLGGYDAKVFRCSADTDIIYRMVRKNVVPPPVIPIYIANFEFGGFSANCNDDFRDENILLLWRNRDIIEQRCQADASYAEIVAAHLLNHCRALCNWQEKYHRRIPEQIDALGQMLRSVPPKTGKIRFTCAAALSRATIRSLAREEKQSSAICLMALFCCKWAHLTPGNSYAPWAPFRATTVLQALYNKIFKH